MEIILLEKFKCLPDELIEKIVNYTDVLVFRNGKYINRLVKTDYRYKLLNNISKPIYSNLTTILRLINNDKKGYLIQYDIKDKFLRANVKFFYRDTDGFDKYFRIASNKTYIFDSNNLWNKEVIYSM